MENSKMIDLQKLVEASGLNITSEQLVELIVEQYTMSQPEIMDRFHFSNQRISNMREQKLLREIKKGLYLREEVENMRAQQISGKRLEKYGDYRLTPAYEDYVSSLIIDQLRFSDCSTCIRVDFKNYDNYDPLKDEYNIHLTEVFNTVIKAFDVGKHVYFFEHRAFQYVRKEEDIQEVVKSKKYWFKEYSASEFLDYLQHPLAEYLGMTRIINYASTVKLLSELAKSSNAI
ncbi:hypothetical protein [Paenibacillus odorifer]|uniref:hypothetical protein n=1 Tax=Paenibacillus odorifer TaxID=189426 RepID=UPI00096D9532|nr:hypothetical protein [Paenibacillus odorifer]OME19938.1 hypothetical protein BSK57_23505 [Paenibacillus odorifer]